MITDSCNCKCSFCSRNNLSLKKEEPKAADVEAALNKLSEEYSQSKLIITGGEPSLSGHFLEYVEYAMSLFRKVEIQSNATFSTSIGARLKYLINQNLYIQFSLDGTREYHDMIRGKGVFDCVLDNLRFFSDEYEHISLSMTITRDNRESALSLAKVLNNYRFRRLSVSIVQPINPLTEILLTKDEWNEFVDNLLPLCYYRVDVSKLYDFEMMDTFLQSGRDWNGYTNCGRGVSHFYISPQFEVLPCTCINESVGNLLIDELHELKERLESASKIKVSESSPCCKCRYLSICNGGCPGLSTKVFGAPNMGDIRCPIIRQYLKNERRANIAKNVNSSAKE